MYGHHVHEAVKNNKEKTGISVHLVNEKFDDGRILLQKETVLNGNESVEEIAQAVHELEYTYFQKQLKLTLQIQAKQMAKSIMLFWEGHKSGIYDNWNACLLQTKNYPKAKYKAYLTKKEADKAFEEGFQKHLFKKKVPITQTSMAKLPSIAVDAACSGNPGLMEYRGVDTHNAQVDFSSRPI